MADCLPDGRDRLEDDTAGIELKIVESSEDEDEEDEPLDPRVQIELENLNSAADSINKLENELQKARAKFRLLKSESSHRLSSVNKKIGRKWVIKARPYYDLLKQSQKAQIEAQKSAIQYQRANGIYRAAKETVTLAEQQLLTDGGEKLAFDSAWQEMLNHATMRFMDAEKEKRITEKEHQAKAADYNSIQLRLQLLHKDMTRTITKAKPFYELKDKMESRLHAERQNAEDLHLALICSKQKYKMALSSLENISEDVHTHRLMKRNSLPPRTPGVGAESDTWSEASELPSANLDFMSETSSQASFDDFSDFDLDLSEWDDPPLSPPPEQGHEDGSIAASLWSRFSNSSNKSKSSADLCSQSPGAENTHSDSTNANAPSAMAANSASGGASGKKTLGGLTSMFGSSPSHSEQFLKPPRPTSGRRERPSPVESPLVSGSPMKTKVRATQSSDPTVRDNLVEGAEAMPDMELSGKGDSDKLTRVERLRVVSRTPSQPLPYKPSPLHPMALAEDAIPQMSMLNVSDLPSLITRQDSTRSDGSGVSSPRGKPPLPFNRVSTGRHSSPTQSSIPASKIPSIRSSPDLTKSTAALAIRDSPSFTASQRNDVQLGGAVVSTEEKPADKSSGDSTDEKSVKLNAEIFV